MADEIYERIREVVTPILNSMGLELVEVEVSGQGRRSQLRIFIDKAGGVTLADCEHANRFIGHALDVADPFPNAYTLEVSSPGLDRPLRHPEDYQRYRGRLIRVKLARPREGVWTLIGRLQGVEEGRLRIQPNGEDPFEVALVDVAQARLEVEW